jgi:hypothetical protein
MVFAFRWGLHDHQIAKVHIESYGCQMNHSDSEIVASILAKDGYELAATPEEADLVLLNTCSIREKAEYTVMQRINEMNNLKAKNKGLKVGVLGCMAERMKENLLVEKTRGGPGGRARCLPQPAAVAGRSGQRPKSGERAAEPRGDLR